MSIVGYGNPDTIMRERQKRKRSLLCPESYLRRPEGGCVTKECCKSRDLEGVIGPLTRAKACQDSEKV